MYCANILPIYIIFNSYRILQLARFQIYVLNSYPFLNTWNLLNKYLTYISILLLIIQQQYYEVGYPHSSLIISDAFSAIMYVGILVWPDGIIGIIEASTTLNPFIPITCKISFPSIILYLNYKDCSTLFPKKKKKYDKTYLQRRIHHGSFVTLRPHFARAAIMVNGER